MRVLFLRRGFGITQEKISEMLNISVPTLRKKEKGELDFTRGEMLKITDYFKMYDSKLTLEDIFFTQYVCETIMQEEENLRYESKTHKRI